MGATSEAPGSWFLKATLALAALWALNQPVNGQYPPPISSLSVILTFQYISLKKINNIDEWRNRQHRYPHMSITHNNFKTIIRPE